MPKATIRLISHPSRYPSVWLLAAAICLCPAAAQALDPTETATGNGALASQGSGAFYNTADGFNVLYHNSTGPYNTANGALSLFSNTTGNSNTASGIESLYSNTTGNSNTASGSDALYFNTTGNSNTASGFAALIANTTGSSNTASGVFALYNNNTGYYNTASGVFALYSNTTGNNNVALGYQTLQANAGGNNNVAVGTNALYSIKGTNNIALGASAGKLTTSGASNIYIGHPGFNGNESKVTRIGALQTQTFIAGIAHTPLSGAAVVIKPNGQLGVVASSARYKQDINSLHDASRKLAQLRPVSYRYKSEPQATHYGLIAEEVDKVMPELVVRDEKNRPESVQYQELIPLLLQQWKAQQAENARLRAELAELRRTLATRLATLDGTAKASGAK